jgi:blue copper oxidase
LGAPLALPRILAALGGEGEEVLPRTALRIPAAHRPDGLTLVADRGLPEMGAGVRTEAWMLNGSVPSPLLRVRQGERFRVTLENRLPDPLILHWHGLTPPAEMDGHPHYAVAQGGRFEYDFVVENIPGLYWYHSHTHYRTARHAWMGIAGMILVDPPEGEAEPALPSGPHEIPLVLQDRRIEPGGKIQYTNPNVMEGHLGTAAFGNGVHLPYLEVEPALYRFRLLNGSNARVLRLELSDGTPLHLIGNDGGFLDEKVTLPWIDMAPGERNDVLIDLRGKQDGDHLLLGSSRFVIESWREIQGGQGSPLDFLELRVRGKSTQDPLTIPDRLPGRESRTGAERGPQAADAVRERTFHLASALDRDTRSMMMHSINGHGYDMHKIDVRVPFDETEIWTLVNDDGFAHPVHLHATHFRVLSREGGRGRLMPWEAGLKDTVLLHPEETVRIAVRFTAHRGLFLLHCHNLEHEDVGMMLNVLVE